MALTVSRFSCLYTDKDYPEDHMEFVQNHNISLKPFDMEENKEPFNGINEKFSQGTSRSAIWSEAIVDSLQQRDASHRLLGGVPAQDS